MINQKQTVIWMPYDFFYQISLAEPDATVETVTKKFSGYQRFSNFYCLLL